MADRRLFMDFNFAYATESTPQEEQLVNDLLTIWGKLEPAVGKNPAAYRKGILFGVALQKAVQTGKIIVRPAREKRHNAKPSV